MTTYQAKDLGEVLRSIGRAVVFYADAWTPGDGELELEHLGDTEGEIEPDVETEYSELVLEELGGGPREKDVQNETITLEIPLFLADPELLPVISPTGSASAGYSRPRGVYERTLVIFPERLLVADDGTRKELTYSTGDGWQLDSESLSEDEERLLGLSLWVWRGHFDRQLPAWRADEHGKVVRPCTFMGMHQSAMPEGNMLYTVGDPGDEDIDITGGS